MYLQFQTQGTEARRVAVGEGVRGGSSQKEKKNSKINKQKIHSPFHDTAS